MISPTLTLTATGLNVCQTPDFKQQLTDMHCRRLQRQSSYPLVVLADLRYVTVSSAAVVGQADGSAS